MSVKSVVYSDGHIDAPGPGGFNTAEGLPQSNVEALKSLRLTVDLANDKGADFVIAPGDLFHNGKPSPEIVARIDAEFSRLDSGTKAILIDGNHDQQGILVNHRTALDAYFSHRPWCAGVWSEHGVREFDGFTLAGLPWVRVSTSNALGATNEALARAIGEMADAVKGNGPSMFAGHLTVSECSFDSGLRGSEITMGTAAIEASIPVAKIDEGPWSVARLGHIHARQQLSDKTGYTGSPYKVSFGETKHDKGVDLVTITDNNIATVEFHKFDVRELIRIDLTTGPAPSVSARAGDIVRLIANDETIDKAKSLEKSFASAGAITQIHRVPATAVAVAREAQYSTDMSPKDAFAAYLDKKGVPSDQRTALSDTFADISSKCC